MRFPSLYLASRRFFVLARYLLRRPHDPDFAAFANWKDNSGVFLDVGANSGTSALSFRIYNRAMPIVSIEPNPYHEPDLRLLGHLLKGFNYRMLAAGDDQGHLSLNVPFFRKVPLTGLASGLDDQEAGLSWWVKEHLANGEEAEIHVESVSVPILPLDQLNLSPAIVKIDVEGMELIVLRGLAKTLERCRPLLLLETPKDFDEVAAYLATWSYEPRAYDRSARAFRPWERSGASVFFVSEGGGPQRVHRT
jgi:FkbM family methyltransferase